MSSDRVCPNCGTPLPSHTSNGSAVTEDEGRTIDMAPETSAEIEPAPGPFSEESVIPRELLERPSEEVLAVSEVDPVLADIQEYANRPQGTSDTSIPSLDLDLNEPSGKVAEPEAAAVRDEPQEPRPAPQAAEPEEEEDEDAVHRVGLGTILLASYASAITIAFLWLWWHGPRAAEPSYPDAVLTDNRPDLGMRGDQSQNIAPAPKIPKDHLTTLGQPLQLGLLEFTPLSVRRGPVTLEHVGFDSQAQDPQRRQGRLDPQGSPAQHVGYHGFRPAGRSVRPGAHAVGPGQLH